MSESDWWERYGKALREPFPAGQIGSLPRGGVRLDYVGHAAVTDRLLHVDPIWTWEPAALDEQGLPRILFDEPRGMAVLWVRLTVGGLTRIGVGTAPSNKQDLEKELISDALRNAAMRFGVALDLWAKEDLTEQSDSPKAAPTARRKPKPAEPTARQGWRDTASALLAEDPVGWQDSLDRIQSVFGAMVEAGLWSPKGLDLALKGRKIQEVLDDFEPALKFWEKTKTAALRDLEKAG